MTMRMNQMRGAVMKQKYFCRFLTILICLVLLGGVEASADDDPIIIKVLGVNPSRKEKQEIALKAYLPYEAKPEDILELGDFKVDYDVAEDSYYVYKVVELGPGESASGQVAVKDIWSISQAETESLLMQAQEFVERLEESPYHSDAVDLYEEIEDKIADIFQAQADASSESPHLRIGIYRKNIEKISSIKEKLGQMEKLLFEYELATKIKTPAKLSTERSWAIILGVILILGLLSFVFFIIWNKQARTLQGKKEDEAE